MMMASLLLPQPQLPLRPLRTDSLEMGDELSPAFRLSLCSATVRRRGCDCSADSRAAA